MKLTNKKSLRYELGVMMYHTYMNSTLERNELDTSEVFLNNSHDYDINENFKSIIQCFDTNANELKDGFVQAAKNNLELSDSEIEQMFAQAVSSFDITK